MSPQNQILLIPKIERGFVIDHIPAGFGVPVMALIGRRPELNEAVVTLGLNYNSTRMGRKDMIKLQADTLPPRLMQMLALVSPGITIKRIANFEVVEKVVIQVPELFDNLARCINPNCITNVEPHVPTRFKRIESGSRHFKCAHCERVCSLDELAEHLKA
jgi:aspartate carbamoyltransferase regulatory subunit